MAVLLRLLLGVFLINSALASTIDLSSCSDSVGCLTVPPDCDGASCLYVVSWTAKDNGAKIEIQVQSRHFDEAWTALGFSKSGEMGDTSVIACLKSGSNIVVKQYYNEGKTPQLVDDPTLGLTVVETANTDDDGLYCKVEKEVAVSGDDKVFPLTRDYYLIVGGGNSRNPGSVGYHNERTPSISSSRIDISSTFGRIGAAGPTQVLKKAHGALMICAWVFTASVGILMARYMKTAWPGQEIAQKAVWFQFHRLCMVLTFLLNSAGFIVIFVDVGDWSSFPEGTATYQKAHPIIGVVITVLCVLNPIMALCRPGPNAKRRPIFNWCHWGVGSAAFTLSMINVYFGMTLPSANFTPLVTRYLMIAFMALFILIEVFLEINKCIGDKKEKDTAIEMQEPGTQIVTSKPQSPSNLRSRYGLVCVFAVATVGLVAAMVALIVIDK